MAEGGDTDMSMGFGDPFAKPRDYDKEKAQGAENFKRLKGFFGFGDKEETAPSKAPEMAPSGGGRRPIPTVGASTSRVSSDEGIRTSSGPQRKIPSDETKGPVFSSNNLNMGEGEYSGDGLTPAQGYKPSSMPSAPRKPKEVSVEKERTKVTASPGYKRSGATAEELERYAGPFRVTESANKMRKEAEDKIRDRKPGSMTKQMRDAPSISDLYKGQKSMGEEVGDALKSFRASIRGGLKSAKEKRETREAEASAAKGGQVKKMAYGGSADDGMAMGQPMRGAPRPVPAPPMNPNSIAALQAQYGTRGPGGGNDMNAPRYPGMKAGGKVKMAMGGETMGPRNMSQDVEKGSNKDIAHGEHGLQKRGKTRAMMPKMKGSPIGDVPAFAKGGMVGRASSRGDGIASKGRTRGKLC
jgi:hypothetical protein